MVGFGLSNDERRGVTSEFAGAFAIAERAGLMLAPHGGELLGPDSIRTCLDVLHADRLGHGVRAAEDPALLDRIVQTGVALEVCPVSNVALGVYSDLTSVPLPTLLDAGATIALGADDPLLFGSQLAAQYATMRAAHELSDETLAELARMSVRASRAPDDTKSERDRRHRRVARRRTWEHGPMSGTDPEEPTQPTSPAVHAELGDLPAAVDAVVPAGAVRPGSLRPAALRPAALRRRGFAVRSGAHAAPRGQLGDDHGHRRPGRHVRLRHPVRARPVRLGQGRQGRAGRSTPSPSDGAVAREATVGYVMGIVTTILMGLAILAVFLIFVIFAATASTRADRLRASSRPAPAR